MLFAIRNDQLFPTLTGCVVQEGALNPDQPKKIPSNSCKLHPVICTHYIRKNEMCQSFHPPTNAQLSLWCYSKNYHLNYAVVYDSEQTLSFPLFLPLYMSWSTR